MCFKKKERKKEMQEVYQGVMPMKDKAVEVKLSRESFQR